MGAKVYDILMIDPPWAQRKGGKRSVRPMQGISLDYPIMTVADIFSLLDRDIFPLAAESHSVFMWVIDKYLSACEEVMLARGYRRHCRLVWNKLNGVAPAFTVRFTHEYLTWYYKGPFRPVDPPLRGRLATVFSERSRQHSRKPDLAYKMVGLLYPAASKLDVFSREQRYGWDQYGNQIDHFNTSR